MNRASSEFPEFTFAFQPIVNIATGVIVSFEALVRGKNNESAYQVFQQVSEAGKYHFDELLRVAAIPLAMRLGLNCNLNLNIFPHSVEVYPTAISSTLEMADRSGLPHNRITLEITETEITANILWFKELINQHRSSGVQVSIDDFGAGYAGLNLLADFQPDSVKIDMSIIRNINTQGPRQAIVRGLIRTCRDLGIDVIAEGVETEPECRWCFDEGIELYQGYFIGRPGFEHLPLAFFPKY
jgi:blue light- and temperature-responsive anti-repressor